MPIVPQTIPAGGDFSSGPRTSVGHKHTQNTGKIHLPRQWYLFHQKSTIPTITAPTAADSTITRVTLEHSKSIPQVTCPKSTSSASLVSGCDLTLAGGVRGGGEREYYINCNTRTLVIKPFNNNSLITENIWFEIYKTQFRNYFRYMYKMKEIYKKSLRNYFKYIYVNRTFKN